MFLSFQTRAQRAAGRSLYGAAVAQARTASLFETFEVADTVDGRFDMIALHVFLLVRRLGRIGRNGKVIGQALFDAMFVDMDLSLRERGVGDLAVPKHIKRMMKFVHGRFAAYDAALNAKDLPALMAALHRNIHRGADVSDGALFGLADYVRQADMALEQQDNMDLVQGRAVFPSWPTDGRAENESQDRYGYSAA